MGAGPETNSRRCEASTRRSYLAQHGKEPVAGALLGKLLVRAAGSGSVFAKSNFPYRSNLVKLFQNPAISADDKATAAAKIASEIEHGDIENPLHACGLVRCAAPFMSPKDRAAAVRRLAYLLIPPDGPKQQSADPISAIADLLADLEDGDTRREISEMLKRECDKVIYGGGNDACRMAVERIRLDPDNALRHLRDLLRFSLKAHSEDFRNEIAIATFQADPDGNAYVPGTEVIDKEKNPLNDEYVDSGTKFGYDREPWLVQRRAQLQEFARSAGLNGGIFGGAMHDLQAHAQISRDYAGIAVFPSDWPRLREHLRTLHELDMYIPQMRHAIEEAMREHDRAPALLKIEHDYATKLSCSAEERARIVSDILRVYAQGSEARKEWQAQEYLDSLGKFIETFLQLRVLCNTEISSATLGQLIDRLVLPGSSQDSMLPTAMEVCGRLCGAQHEDITPLYGLADVLIERVARTGKTWYLEDCVGLIAAIPDPRVQIALAEKVMTHIANLPNLSRVEMNTLISVAKTLKTREGLEVAGQHLGKFLVRTTAPAILFTNEAMDWAGLQPLFAHPAISEADKRTAAAQLATGVVLGMGTDLGALAVGPVVTCAAPFMTQADRTAAARWLRDASFPWRGPFPMVASRISAISALVAGVEGDPHCRDLQDFLKSECERYVNSSGDEYDKAAVVAELIRLDPAHGLRILPGLLARSARIHRNWDAEMCNLIAIATFQADPMGEAFVPGSEVVDVAKNPLSDSYIDRGTKFVYPQWLAIRRAELLRFSQASSARLAAQIHQDIPQSVLALARIEEEYSGISIQPSDWPALGAHLMEVFPVGALNY